MAHIQATGFYMIHQWYAVENFTATAISDVQIDLAWDIIQAGMTGIVIEWSTDGVNYTELDFVGGTETSYQVLGLTTNTQYWFRIRGVKSSTYSEYCTPADDWTAWKLVVTARGNASTRAYFILGAGISNDIRCTIDGNGLFWTGVTSGTSMSEYTIPAGTDALRAISVSSGSANIYVFHQNNILQWGEYDNPFSARIGFSQYNATNSPYLTLAISDIPNNVETIYIGTNNGGSITGTTADLPSILKYLYLTSSALSGNVSDLPDGLINIYLAGTNTVTGDCSGFPSGMEYINVTGSNTISGNVSGIPQNGLLYYLNMGGSNALTGDIGGLYYSNCILEYLNISGSNTISGNISGISDMDILENLNISGNNTITGDISGFSDMDTLELINISGSNTISGDVSGFPQNGVLYSIQIRGNNIISGDVSGLDYSGCALTTLYLYGNNTVNGDISGLPETLTYTIISGENEISGDIGGITTSGYLSIAGNNTIEGDIADIPNDTFTSISITGENTLTGDVANLPNLKLTYINFIGNNTLYGDFEDIPVNITHIDIRGGSGNIAGDINNLPSDSAIVDILLDHTTLTGDIANFPNTLRYISITGANTLYGDLADLPSSVYSFILTGNNAVSDYTPPSGGKTWMNLATTNKDFNFQPASGGGLSSTEVDDLIIDLDASASGTYTRIIYITGNNDPRTSASDAAVASLLSKGITVITNP